MGFHRDSEAMRRFYDGFFRLYGLIEGSTGRSIARAFEVLDPEGHRFQNDSLLEHCCGSGSLGLRVAARFASYEGRDQSAGMLERAGRRWRSAFGEEDPPPFSRESALEFADPADSTDWIAMAFGIHLFPPEEERRMLEAFWKSARRGVLIIDHKTGFSPLLSLVEALEGSWFEAYRRLDFAALARGLGAGYREFEADGARVLEFTKG